MENEFIPYEEALALKELGFDEPCLTYYFSDGVFNDAAEEDYTLHPGDPRFYSDTNSLLAKCYEDELKYKAVAAPLYQQAFRWFREKYPKLAAIVVPGNMSEEQRDFFITLYLPDKDSSNITRIHKEIGPYETYEEAELACLRKLIEIVKNAD